MHELPLALNDFFLLANELGFSAASIIGTLAFAFSGFIMGANHRLDIMGIFIASALPAVGGGILRDIIVGRTPAVLSDPEPLMIVTLAVLIGFLFRLHKVTNLEKHVLFIISDSLGLVAFSITGALVGIEVGLNIFGVIVLAFITAVGGGIIRDVLINNVPMILQGGFYGTVSVLIALAMYFLNLYGYNNSISLAILFIAGMAVRLTAYFKDWYLPRLNY